MKPCPGGRHGRGSRCGKVKRERLDWLAANPRYTKRFRVRRAAMSRRLDHGGGRGPVPRLAHGQGDGQAVHARATGPRRRAAARGHRHRRDRHSERTRLSHRRQRSRTRAADLVRRRGSVRGELGDVLRLSRRAEVRADPLAVMDMWKPFRRRRRRRRPPRFCTTSSMWCGSWATRWIRCARRSTSGSPAAIGVHQGPEVRPAVASGEPLPRRQGLKTLLAANKRLNTAYLLKENFGQLWCYHREGWARRFFEQWRAA